MDHLALEGRDWQLVSTLIPRKLPVVNLDVVSKVWTYFLCHTLDTNQSGSKLITLRAMAFYLLLTRCSVNVRRIISSDMDEMTHSRTKKSLGNASVILLECSKA